MMKKIYESASQEYWQFTKFIGLDGKDAHNFGLAAVKASSKL
jgi:hypothetical protein